MLTARCCDDPVDPMGDRCYRCGRDLSASSPWGWPEPPIVRFARVVWRACCRLGRSAAAAFMLVDERLVRR